MQARSFLNDPGRPLPGLDSSPLSEAERRSLVRFVEQSLDHKFRLAVIETAGAAERERILAEVAPIVGPRLLGIAVDECPGAEQNLWAALQEPFASSSPRCLALWGFENLSRADWPHQLNVQRDLYVRDFAVPWLVFIHPASRVALLQSAPDFCDFAVLWLRDDRVCAPVVPAVTHAADNSLPLAHSGADDSLLGRARGALEAARFDEARDALTQFDLQGEHDGVDRVRRRLLEARLQREQGHSALAEASASEARDALARLPASDETRCLEIVLDGELAKVFAHEGRYDEAEAVLRSALSLAERVLGREHSNYVALLQNLANVLERRGEYAEAENLLAEVLAHLARRDDPLPYSTSLGALAGVLMAQGRHAEAERALQEELALEEKILGREHPMSLRARVNLGVSFLRRKRFAEAEQTFRESLPLVENVLGRGHWDYGMCLHNLGGALLGQMKWSEAEAILRESLAVLGKTLGGAHPEYGLARHSLALALMSQGKFAEAEQEFRGALSILERALGPDHPELCSLLSGLAVLLANAGRVSEGIKFRERALSIAQAIWGLEHPRTRMLADTLAQLQPR